MYTFLSGVVFGMINWILFLKYVAEEAYFKTFFDLFFTTESLLLMAFTALTWGFCFLGIAVAGSAILNRLKERNARRNVRKLITHL